MEIRKFMDLQKYDNLLSISNPKVGDKFLTGNSMVSQIERKNIGDEVSWYEIISVRENGDIEYTLRYGKLKSPNQEE
jgi:hypothetical protein